MLKLTKKKTFTHTVGKNISFYWKFRNDISIVTIATYQESVYIYADHRSFYIDAYTPLKSSEKQVLKSIIICELLYITANAS